MNLFVMKKSLEYAKLLHNEVLLLQSIQQAMLLSGGF
jgi:hypothetical protein